MKLKFSISWGYGDQGGPLFICSRGVVFIDGGTFLYLALFLNFGMGILLFLGEKALKERLQPDLGTSFVHSELQTILRQKTDIKSFRILIPLQLTI